MKGITQSMDEDLKNQVIDLYLNKRLSPVDIAKQLGFKYHQPIYNFLKKEKIFERNFNGFGNLRTYEVDETFFEKIDSEHKAYTLGFITADGYVDEDRKALKISLNVKDIDILQKILLSMSSTHPIREFIKDKKYKHCCIDIGSSKIVSDLKKLGLYQGKSLTMTGSIVNKIPEELMRHFLRGYADGDGNIFYGGRYSSGVKFCVTVIGTKDFLEASFGRFCITNCKISKYKSCNMYAWKSSKRDQVDAYLDYLYKDSTIYLDRKYSQYLLSKTF